MLDQCAPLPVRRFAIAAGLKMRAADAHHTIECEAVVGSEVERNLEPLDGRFGIAAVDVDPSAAAPGPGRAAVDRKCFADYLIRPVEVMQEGEGVAEDGKYCRVAGEILCLSSQFGASRAVLVRGGGDMVDDALPICPGGERGRQRMVGVALHRALQ